MLSRLPDVKDTFLRLLGSEPHSLFVTLPDLAASIQVLGFPGFGATSHVYEVAEGGQQVVSSIVCSIEVPSKLVLFPTSATWH